MFLKNAAVKRVKKLQLVNLYFPVVICYILFLFQRLQEPGNQI